MPAAVNEAVDKARAIGMDLKENAETCQWFISREINTDIVSNTVSKVCDLANEHYWSACF